MRNQKNETPTPPQISITAAGGKQFCVNLSELTEFLDRVHEANGDHVRQEIDYYLEDIADLVVAGATPEDNSVDGMKRTYNFVKNLRFLFKGMLYENRS